MAPIPIHKNSPIVPTTAAKADGVTPSTASSASDNASNPPPPTRTTPAYAPATTTQSSSNPPAPQPGARPAAPTQQAGGGGGYDGTPAPPQPGATPTATYITTETRLDGPPAQFSNPPPSDSYLSSRSTATSTTASKPGPTTLNYGPAASPFQSADAGGTAQPRTSLEHPPGYVQAPDNAPYTTGGGIGVGGYGGRGAGEGSESGEGVGAAAWSMLSKAGEALKKGEEAAWRAIKNKNGSS
ncbi:hypothetical protein EJ02DRAFT_61627 [Clathrospora elynae]|uniref:Uncharacterized protein n=1 Tax=Clathrospora elynae TaxID=706981 RepID=A0A6A5SC61_9PLEO|nr:hypothetical protein EJ02DRAFT_61627 [Clathrospora elynae]